MLAKKNSVFTKMVMLFLHGLLYVQLRVSNRFCKKLSLIMHHLLNEQCSTNLDTINCGVRAIKIDEELPFSLCKKRRVTRNFIMELSEERVAKKGE